MNNGFYQELGLLSREDDLRPKLLMRRVKQILKDRQDQGMLKKMFRKKKQVVPKSWA